MAKQKDWIQKTLGDKGDKGKLHRALGLDESKKIPLATLKTAAKRDDKVGEMAKLALELRGMNK